MRHLQHVVLSLCVLAAACAGEAPTAPTVASSATSGAAVTEAQGGSELPFRGTFQATERFSTADDPMNHLVGTGTATHLGRFTLTSDSPSMRQQLRQSERPCGQRPTAASSSRRSQDRLL